MPIPTVNRCAESYEKNKEVNNVHLAEYLPQLLETLKPGKNELILDHGCGGGGTLTKYLVPYAEKTNSTIYGLDNSESMIKHAQEHNPHPRVHYVTGTMTAADSPVKGLKFNKIFSLFTIHHIDDYKSELQALAASLAPGGEMFMIVVIDCLMFTTYKHIKIETEFADHATHLAVPRWLDQPEKPFDILKNDIEKLGLQVENISNIERTFTYQNYYGFTDMLFALCAFVKNLTPESQARLYDICQKLHRETETKTYKPHAEAPNNEYIFHYISLHAHLKKA